jgi:hypothetical protein
MEWQATFRNQMIFMDYTNVYPGSIYRHGYEAFRPRVLNPGPADVLYVARVQVL